MALLQGALVGSLGLKSLSTAPLPRRLQQSYSREGTVPVPLILLHAVAGCITPA